MFILFIISSFSFCFFFFFFFFNDTATTEIYTLSLHDALPISAWLPPWCSRSSTSCAASPRSEEHTSELQSHSDLVCRLLLEKKKNKTITHTPTNKNKQPKNNDTKPHNP